MKEQGSDKRGAQWKVFVMLQRLSIIRLTFNKARMKWEIKVKIFEFFVITNNESKNIQYPPYNYYLLCTQLRFIVVPDRSRDPDFLACDWWDSVKWCLNYVLLGETANLQQEIFVDDVQLEGVKKRRQLSCQCHEFKQKAPILQVHDSTIRGRFWMEDLLT